MGVTEPSGERVPTVDPARFRGLEDERPGQWTDTGAPTPWHGSPGSARASEQLTGHLAAALLRLPDRQRAVISLRDVRGLSADEVCRALELTPTDQRALLHQARATLRAALEDYFGR